MADETSECSCGHEFAAHEHYRRGTPCALCDCPKFRRPRTSLIDRLFRR
ncbi:hypothetical protein [Rhodococcus sp. ABRD24]|nr:hypothetical protein [Rhodococcus sp. ABRD24]